MNLIMEEEQNPELFMEKYIEVSNRVLINKDEDINDISKLMFKDIDYNNKLKVKRQQQFVTVGGALGAATAFGVQRYFYERPAAEKILDKTDKKETLQDIKSDKLLKDANDPKNTSNPTKIVMNSDMGDTMITAGILIVLAVLAFDTIKK